MTTRTGAKLAATELETTRTARRIPSRLEIWKVVVGVAAVGLLSGVLGYKIGATPPAPIVIQLAAPDPLGRER
jgi:hypothetical protein